MKLFNGGGVMTCVSRGRQMALPGNPTDALGRLVAIILVPEGCRPTAGQVMQHEAILTDFGKLAGFGPAPACLMQFLGFVGRPL